MDKKNIIYIAVAIVAILILTHPVVLHIIGALFVLGCLYYIWYLSNDIIDIIKTAKERKDNKES